MPRGLGYFELMVGDAPIPETAEAFVLRRFGRRYPGLVDRVPPKLVQEAIRAARGRGKPPKGTRGLNVVLAEIGHHMAGAAVHPWSISRQKQRRAKR